MMDVSFQTTDVLEKRQDEIDAEIKALGHTAANLYRHLSAAGTVCLAQLTGDARAAVQFDDNALEQLCNTAVALRVEALQEERGSIVEELEDRRYSADEAQDEVDYIMAAE